MKRLEFWFDFSSPFAYLGSTQVARIADAHGAELVHRPFLLGALFQAIGTPLVPMFEVSDAKRQYLAKDLKDWAKHWSVPLEWPSRFPLRTIKPLRLVLAAPAEQRTAIVDRLMRLCWAEDGDPDDDATLTRCLEECGASAALLARTQDPEIKAELKAATEEAARREFPGAPIFLVGDAYYWGQDRLHFVEQALES